MVVKQSGLSIVVCFYILCISQRHCRYWYHYFHSQHTWQVDCNCHHHHHQEESHRNRFRLLLLYHWECHHFCRHFAASPTSDCCCCCWNNRYPTMVLWTTTTWHCWYCRSCRVCHCCLVYYDYCWNNIHSSFRCCSFPTRNWKMTLSSWMIMRIMVWSVRTRNCHFHCCWYLWSSSILV